jgi:hypothetical protein
MRRKACDLRGLAARTLGHHDETAGETHFEFEVWISWPPSAAGQKIHKRWKLKAIQNPLLRDSTLSGHHNTGISARIFRLRVSPDGGASGSWPFDQLPRVSSC